MKNRAIVIACVLLAGAEVLLVLLSWVLSATMTEGVRSLLTSEGMRWFMGQFVTFTQTPVLVWLLLLSMAYGCVRQGLFPSPADGSRRAGLLMSLFALIVYVVVILLLTLPHHAVLLSATGSLFPSLFSRALVPIIAFGLIIVSLANAFTSRVFRSVSDVFGSFAFGISQASPLFFLYILAVQFCESLRFVFL